MDFIPCTTKDYLPEHLQISGPGLSIPEGQTAAETAFNINPANRPRRLGLIKLGSAILAQAAKLLGVPELPQLSLEEIVTPGHLALLTTKYWGPKVDLTVSFLDTSDQGLIQMILSHMNAWGPSGPGQANVTFRWTQQGGQVRIARSEQAYYSYLGTDILHISPSEHTMMLGGFTLNVSESERRRVIRHETGHTLGFPHEHMLPELVARLDVQKTIDYFQRTQGWTPQETMQQVLTAINIASVRMTPHADQNSIMCYQLPGSITTDGLPINGGLDIDSLDAAFIQTQYPPVGLPPSPPPPPPVSPPPPPPPVSPPPPPPPVSPPPPPVTPPVIDIHVDINNKFVSFVIPKGWTGAGKHNQEGAMSMKPVNPSHIAELEKAIALPEGVSMAPDLISLVTAVRSFIAAAQKGDYMGMLTALNTILSMILNTAQPSGTDGSVSFTPQHALFGGGSGAMTILGLIAKILAEALASA